MEFLFGDSFLIVRGGQRVEEGDITVGSENIHWVKNRIVVLIASTWKFEVESDFRGGEEMSNKSELSLKPRKEDRK